jgi:DNA-binding transcriptional LysR family regulator
MESVEPSVNPILSYHIRSSVPPWPTAALFAVYPDRSYRPAKVRSFLDFLVEVGFPRILPMASPR